MRFRNWLAIALVVLLAFVAVNAFAPIEVVDIQTEVASVEIADAAEVSIEGVTVAAIEIPATVTDTLTVTDFSTIPNRSAILQTDVTVLDGFDHLPGPHTITVAMVGHDDTRDTRPLLDAFGDGGIL